MAVDNRYILEANKLLFMDTSGYPLPGKVVPCLLCAEPFIMRKFTGHPDQICGECSKTYHECAVVYCSKCKVVICRLGPTVLDTGYRIKPREVLHSNACNICAPGIKESYILEIDAWERLVRPRKVISIASKYGPVQ